jgi:hypothetical protein
MTIWKICFTGLLFWTIVLHAQDQDDILDQEIQRVRKELAQVQTERRTLRDDMRNDRKDFDAYESRTGKRIETLQNEIDSIKTDIRSLEGRKDSVTASVRAHQAGQLQYDLLQDNFRNILMEACDSCLLQASLMPPLNTMELRSALQLLKSECGARGIDNTEAVNRFAEILRKMDEISSSIQIAQGESPVPEVRGTIYRLRIGSFFDAVVNAQATTYALWEGPGPDGNPLWMVGHDATTAENILKAVKVREGKATPAIIALPLGEMTAEELQ